VGEKTHTRPQRPVTQRRIAINRAITAALEAAYEATMGKVTELANQIKVLKRDAEHQERMQDAGNDDAYGIPNAHNLLTEAEAAWSVQYWIAGEIRKQMLKANA